MIALFAGLLLFCALSFSGQYDAARTADPMLDTMEYESAIVNYMRALSENPGQQDIRKNMGYAYFQLGKAEEAIRLIKEELTIFPDNQDTYDLFLCVLYKEDRIREYHEFLNRLNLPTQSHKENPNAGLGDFILGIYFKEGESFEKASKFFRKALERGHDPIKCYVQLLDIYLIRLEKDMKSPIAGLGRVLLNEAIKTYGGTPSEIHFMMGLRYLEMAKVNVRSLLQSIEAFELAAKLRPDIDLIDSLFNLGSIYYNRNDFEEASEYFQSILEKEPENEAAKFYLDCCLKRLDRSLAKDLPLEECPESINLSREFIDKPDREYKYQLRNDAHFVLKNINDFAVEFTRQGKFDDALKRLRHGLSISPESPALNLNAGIVHAWLNDFEEAEKYTLLALRQKDYFGGVPAYRKREILKERKKESQEEIEIPLSDWDFEMALKEGNYFLDAYNHLGTIYFQKKEFKKSILAFQKTIEIYPGDARGHYNLGSAYREMGEWEKAEEEWKKAIKYENRSKTIMEKEVISKDQLDISLIVLEESDSFKAHKCLGKLYKERNLPEKALEEYEKAIDLQPNDSEPYYELGKIYYEKSERNRKYVNQAILYLEKYRYLGGEKDAEAKALLKALKEK